MRLMVCGLTLIFLTACGKTEQAAVPVAPAVAVAYEASVPAGFYPPGTSVPASAAPEELNMVVRVDPQEKPPSPEEKKAAKAAAEELIKVMLDLEQVLNDSSVMNDTWHYGLYFYRVINDPLVRWQKMSEAGAYKYLGDLGYCREAARALEDMGAMIHDKHFAQQFLDQRRSKYEEVLPKCRRAVEEFN